MKRAAPLAPHAALAVATVAAAAIHCGPPPRPAPSPTRATTATTATTQTPRARTDGAHSGDATTVNAVVYTVVQGDTLIALARRFHVAGGVDALVRLNALARADRIRDGQGLLVPANPPFTDEEPAYRAPARFEPPLRECRGVAHGAPPAEQPRPGCSRAACARSGAVEACACVADDPTQSGFTVRDGAQTRARWTGLPFLGDPTAFELSQGDLDGDGAPETVVAVLESEASGLGTRTWTVRVLPGARAPSNAAPAPLRVRVDEYGVGTFLAREAGASGAAATPTGCDLLATEWAWLRDPLRGDGLYLLARRFAVRTGALAPTGAPPLVLARRMLTDFRGEASAGRPGPRVGAPAAWLGEGRAEIWPADPAVDGRRGAPPREGELVSAALRGADPARLRLALEVRWRDDGTTSTLEPRARGEADAPTRYERAGDAAAGAVWPLGYAPSAPEAWRGAPVRVTESHDARGEVHRVVWLGAARPAN